MDEKQRNKYLHKDVQNEVIGLMAFMLLSDSVLSMHKESTDKLDLVDIAHEKNGERQRVFRVFCKEDLNMILNLNENFKKHILHNTLENSLTFSMLTFPILRKFHPVLCFRKQSTLGVPKNYRKSLKYSCEGINLQLY